MVRLMASKVRLFVDHPLGEGQTVPLDRDQSNYLFAVMRLPAGSTLSLINGADGEWEAEVAIANKRGGSLTCLHQTRPQVTPPDVWLIFAPIKKARTDFIVEKAVELGVRRILPVTTEFTNSDRIRHDRLQAHATEAAEQCGGTYVPAVDTLQKLPDLLADWPNDRQLIFCDEAVEAQADPANWPASPAAILIGPEGGFSDAERSRLRAMKAAHTVALGPRILRADTAAVAALALWQSAHGDW